MALVAEQTVELDLDDLDQLVGIAKTQVVTLAASITEPVVLTVTAHPKLKSKEDLMVDTHTVERIVLHALASWGIQREDLAGIVVEVDSGPVSKESISFRVDTVA